MAVSPFLKNPFNYNPAWPFSGTRGLSKVQEIAHWLEQMLPAMPSAIQTGRPCRSDVEEISRAIGPRYTPFSSYATMPTTFTHSLCPVRLVTIDQELSWGDHHPEDVIRKAAMDIVADASFLLRHSVVPVDCFEMMPSSNQSCKSKRCGFVLHLAEDWIIDVELLRFQMAVAEM